MRRPGYLEISSHLMRHLLIALSEDREVQAEIRTLPEAEIADYASVILERAKEKNQQLRQRLENEPEN